MAWEKSRLIGLPHLLLDSSHAHEAIILVNETRDPK
jgi:hypothetical protein